MRPTKTYCLVALALFLVVQPDRLQAQVAEEDSLALVTIYNATDGPNWTNSMNWLVTPVAAWYGISFNSGRTDFVTNLLTGIQLADNNLTGEFPDISSSLPQMLVLDLSQNHLTGDIPLLTGLQSLQSLKLNDNELSGPIPSSIGIYSELIELDLSNNQLSGDIPTEITSLVKLKTLRLGGNAELSGPLPVGFTNLRSLSILDLAGTGICVPDDPVFQRWMLPRQVTGMILCSTTPVAAEDRVSRCLRSRGDGELNTNNVRARIVNSGGLFYRLEPHLYNVPIDTDGNAIFAADLWIGGMMNDQLRVAASRYGEWEFWAGPIDDGGEGPADCAVYDRIYSVSLGDVNVYESSGQATADLADWPTGLGAPTLDRDGQSIDLMALPLDERKDRVIDLDAGERPQVTGTQTLWWIMNDRGNSHFSTGSLPIGVEVHGSAFAANSLVEAINNSTFYTYRLFNRNTVALTNIYIGLFLDTDLGDFSDDYVGSDSALGLGYTYNSDNEDLGGSEAYGTPPPALGALFLRGPRAESDGIDNDRDGMIDEPGERLRTTSVLMFNGGGSVVGDPNRASDYYNYMQARWKNGRQLTFGGFGYDFSEIATNFSLSGDPITAQFWSEMNIDGRGTRSSAGDRRFLVSSGPFSLGPGEETDFTIAIVWAKGKDNLDSVTQLKRAAAGIQNAFSEGFDELLYRTPQEAQPPPPPRFDLTLDKNFPDPFSESTTIRYTVPLTVHVQITVFNALGRQVRTLVDEEQPAGEYTATMDGAGLPSGVYYYRVEVNQAVATGTMVLVK